MKTLRSLVHGTKIKLIRTYFPFPFPFLKRFKDKGKRQGPYGRGYPGYSWIPQFGDLIRPFKNFLSLVRNYLASVIKKRWIKEEKNMEKNVGKKEKPKRSSLPFVILKDETSNLNFMFFQLRRLGTN